MCKVVLVSYCCCNHKLSVLKQQKCIIVLEVRTSNRSLWAEIKMSLGQYSFWKFLRKTFFYCLFQLIEVAYFFLSLSLFFNLHLYGLPQLYFFISQLSICLPLVSFYSKPDPALDKIRPVVLLWLNRYLRFYQK